MNMSSPNPAAQVLVVDPSPQRRQQLIKLLASQHYRAREASTCEEALRLLAQTPLAVILTDTELPTKSGLFLLQQVKKRYPDSEVILLTHNASSYNLLQALRHGAYDFIVRPIDTGEILFNALDRAFHAVGLRQENHRLLREAETRNELLGQALRMTRALNSSIARLAQTVDIGDLLRELLELAVTQLQAQRGFLALYNPTSGRIGIKVCKGIAASFSDTCHDDIPGGLIRQMIDRGKPLLVADSLPAQLAELASDLEKRQLLTSPGIMMIPLQRGERSVGCMTLVGHPQGFPFTQQDLQFLLQLSQHALLALERAGQIRLLKQAGPQERRSKSEA